MAQENIAIPAPPYKIKIAPEVLASLPPLDEAAFPPLAPPQPPEIPPYYVPTRRDRAEEKLGAGWGALKRLASKAITAVAGLSEAPETSFSRTTGRKSVGTAAARHGIRLVRDPQDPTRYRPPTYREVLNSLGRSE